MVYPVTRGGSRFNAAEEDELKVLLAGWQPIDTAPENGEHVQLFRPNQQFVGYYGGPDSGWRHNAPGLEAIWPHPTHWMPLPAPPTN